jgi:hypothetical protein
MITTTPDSPKEIKDIQCSATASTPGFHLAFLGVAVGQCSRRYAWNLGSDGMTRSTTS